MRGQGHLPINWPIVKYCSVDRKNKSNCEEETLSLEREWTFSWEINDAKGQIQMEATAPVIIIFTRATSECQSCLKLSRWQKLRQDTKILTFLESVIRESRWTAYSQKGSATGELQSLSGHKGYKPSHTRGVVLMLTKMAQTALIGCEVFGLWFSIACLGLKNRGIRMDIIQA